MFGDEIEIGSLTLNPVNSCDNFIAKLQWVGTTGGNEMFTGDARLFVYPNPATDKINISFPAGEEIIIFEAFDNIGKKVIEKRVITNNDYLNIDVSDLPEGLYIFNFYTINNTIVTKKVIIKHK